MKRSSDRKHKSTVIRIHLASATKAHLNNIFKELCLALFLNKLIENHEWLAVVHFSISNNNHVMQSRTHAHTPLIKDVFLEASCDKDTKHSAACFLTLKLLIISQEKLDNLALRRSLMSYSKVGPHDGRCLQRLWWTPVFKSKFQIKGVFPIQFSNLSEKEDVKKHQLY